MNDLEHERAAFMRAILEQPDDDTARLVFADWLEEKGDGAEDRAHARFIREQIAALTDKPGRFWNKMLVGQSVYSMPDLPVWRDACSDCAYATVHNRSHHSQVAWRRGMVEKVTCSFHAWWRCRGRWQEEHPITEALVTMPEGLSIYDTKDRDRSAGTCSVGAFNQWLRNPAFACNMPTTVCGSACDNPWRTHIVFWRIITALYPGVRFYVVGMPTYLYDLFAPEHDSTHFSMTSGPSVKTSEPSVRQP